ncbi:MAG: hypothetical protein DRJ10_10965, partial [Bacteroidetes bacterium]
MIANVVYAQNQITGVVNYHENESNPLPNVTLELYDTGDNFVAATMSNNNGEFIFTNIPSGDYFIRSTSDMTVGDINLIDASLILYHLFGWYPFNDFEFVAADVNGSGSVTFSDYFIVLISYIMQGNPFTIDDWQFQEVYVDLTSRDSTENTAVWGTSTGDVEGIWLPGGRNIINYNEDNTIVTNISEDIVELEIGTNYNKLIAGFNLNLTYPINLLEIIDVTGPDGNLHYYLDESQGILKVIWLDENEKPGTKFFGERLFKIKVKQINNSTKSEEDIFSLLEGGMVLDNNSNQLENITINLPKIKTTNSIIELSLASFPNPVINTLIFKITSPVSSYANIYIYDLSGKLIDKTISTNIYEGTQLINLETRDFPTG